MGARLLKKSLCMAGDEKKSASPFHNVIFV